MGFQIFQQSVSGATPVQQASFIDRQLHEWMHRQRAPLAGVVHSTFARTVNLLTDGKLVTIAAGEIGRAPMTITLSGHLPFHPSPGTAAAISPECILLEGVASISLAHASFWTHDRPSFTPGGHLRASSTSRAVEAIALREQSQRPATSRFPPIWTVIRDEISRLPNALATDDWETRGTVITDRVLGLGPGLTPSGDDTLAGLLAVLAMGNSGLSEEANRLWRIIEAHSRDIGDISFAMLGQSKDCRMHENISTLLEGVGRGVLHPDQAQRVMEIGSSSGIDILVGIAAGLRAVARRQS